MAAYLVLDLTIVDLDQFLVYAEKIPELITRHKGKYIVRGVEPTIIEGDWTPQRVVILEFETKQNAQNFLGDPDSHELFKIRHESTVSKLILLEGT